MGGKERGLVRDSLAAWRTAEIGREVGSRALNGGEARSVRLASAMRATPVNNRKKLHGQQERRRDQLRERASRRCSVGRCLPARNHQAMDIRSPMHDPAPVPGAVIERCAWMQRVPEYRNPVCDTGVPSEFRQATQHALGPDLPIPPGTDSYLRVRP
jgi:hypothetical protein